MLPRIFGSANFFIVTHFSNAEVGAQIELLGLFFRILAFDPPYWSTANIKNLEKKNIFTGFMLQKILALGIVFLKIFKISRKFWMLF